MSESAEKIRTEAWEAVQAAIQGTGSLLPKQESLKPAASVISARIIPRSRSTMNQNTAPYIKQRRRSGTGLPMTGNGWLGGTSGLRHARHAICRLRRVLQGLMMLLKGCRGNSRLLRRSGRPISRLSLQRRTGKMRGERWQWSAASVIRKNGRIRILKILIM